jgi:hypothetical protein
MAPYGSVDTHGGGDPGKDNASKEATTKKSKKGKREKTKRQEKGSSHGEENALLEGKSHRGATPEGAASATKVVKVAAAAAAAAAGTASAGGGRWVHVPN